MFSRWGKEPPNRNVEAEGVAPAENDRRYYAGIALKALLEKWTDDPEKGRFVIAHKAHLIADAMVNAKINTGWEKKEACSG